MRLSKYLLATALAGVLAGPALAQNSSPPTASQVTPSSRYGPLYRTPDAARAFDVNRDPVGPLDTMTSRLRTRSLGELDRLNRLDNRAWDSRRLDVITDPDANWRLGLTPERRRQLIDLPRRYYVDEPANIP